MWPVLVVMPGVLGQDRGQVSLAEDEQPVGALAAYGADPAFCVRVRSRRLRWRADHYVLPRRPRPGDRFQLVPTSTGAWIGGCRHIRGEIRDDMAGAGSTFHGGLDWAVWLITTGVDGLDGRTSPFGSCRHSSTTSTPPQ